ncbi:MAG TPA: DUF2975 domain-containing protein [Vicinamibacterales bacterium]
MQLIGKGSLSSFLLVVFSVAWYVVALVLALTVCLVVVGPWIDARGFVIDIPVSFNVDARAVQVNAPALGVDAAEIRHVRGSLSFPPPSRASFVGPLALVVIMLALVLWVLSQLSAVFRTLRDRRPFLSDNAIRIRRIGYAVILGELARAVMVFSANSYAMTFFSANGLRFEARPDVNAFAIVHGLIILAIAEVFRAGTRLDEDQSLTI